MRNEKNKRFMFKRISLVLSLIMFTSIFGPAFSYSTVYGDDVKQIKDMNRNEKTSIIENVVETTTGAAITLDIPNNIIVESTTSSSITVTWDEVENADGYDIEVDEEIIHKDDSTSYIHSDLIPNSEHKYRLRAKNEELFSEWSELVTGTTLRDLISPENIKAIATSDSITITWDEVQGAEGYDVEVDGEVIDNKNGTSYIHSNLTPSSEHKYRVRAKNQELIGEWSEVIKKSTLERLEDTIIDSNLTLDEDKVYGNLYLKRGVIDLNGHKLKVCGNLIQNGGIVNVNGGRLEIKRDYNLTGSSYLNMSKESDYILVEGNFTTSTKYKQKNLKAGILEIKGDFTRKYGNWHKDNFKPTGTHKVILSGDKLQKVSFENPGDSRFNILDISKSEEVQFGSPISASKLKTSKTSKITKGLILKNSNIIFDEEIFLNCDLTLENSTINLNGNNLTVKGNLTHTSGTLNLNGHKLTIKGNLIQSGGTVYVNGGILEIKGDYNLTGSSYLNMSKESDYILVEGNFTTSTKYKQENLKAGTLEIKGNFARKYGNWHKDNFKPTGTHKVILSGDKLQKVSFENPGDSRFNILDISKSEEVQFDSPISTSKLKTSKTSKITKGLILKNSNIIFDEEIFLNCDLTLENSTINLNGNNLTVKGNLTHTSGTLNLNGHKLTIKGNLIQSGGTVDVNGGRLEIKGDYNLTGSSYLNMSKESDYILVEGYFTASTKYKQKDLKAGTLEVKGNFIQKFGGWEKDNFKPTENHKVILSGDKVQKVSFENPGYSTFNILVVTKPLDTGYDLTKAYYEKSVWTEDGYKRIMVPAWNYLVQGYKTQHHFGKSGTNPATGNFSESFNDMSMKVPGFELEFTRTYNSLDDKSTLLGRGWTFGFEGSLKDYKDLEKIKKVTLPDGSTQLFKINDDGTYEACDSRNELVKQEDGTHILKTKNQYTYGFSENGWLVWMKDNKGNKVIIEVENESGKIQKIIDTAGRAIDISYNEAGLIESITDPIGRRVQYEYEDNKLVRVIDPMGSVTRYFYDSERYLNEIKDNESNTIKAIEYDHAQGENQHKVKSIENAFGNVETYTYDNTNGKTIITDKNGRQTTKWYDSSKYITYSEDAEGRQTKVEYSTDENGINKYGEQEKVTDRNGSTTKYERDDRGNITKIINPDSTFKVLKYDDKNNLIMERDETGRGTYYIYDSEKINLIKMVQALESSEEYTEDSDEDDFAITTYSYYSEGESICNIKGLLKSETDPEGNTTTYTYDKYGNIATVTDGEGNTTTREYNEIGMLIREISPAGNITDYEYNKNGQLTKGVLENLDTTRIVYDSMGRKIKEINPNQYDSSLDQGRTYNGDHGYRYTYYNNGNVRTITDPEDNTISFTYDIYGNKKSETKPNGAVYVYEYDVLNRPSKVYFKESNSSDSIILEEYNYEILSNGETEKTHKVYSDHENSSETTFIYDYAGRLISQTNPDGTTIVTEYNDNGTVKSQRDEKGNTTYLKYDGLNRLSKKWIPFEEEGGTQKYTYTEYVYDKSGNIKEEKTGKDKVLKNETPEDFITINYDYYNNGNIKAVYDDEGRRKEYTYDEEGNLKKEVVYTSKTEKNIIEYKNNHLGKPREKREYVESRDIYGNSLNDSDKAVLITKFTYDKNGNLETVTTPDGIKTTYTYNNLDMQTGVSHPGLNEYGEEVTISTENTYNWEGNVLSSKDANGNVTRYTYNKRGLVKKVKAPNNAVTIKYYDRKGRLIAKVTPKNYDPDKSLDEMNRSQYIYDSMDRIIVVNEVYLNPVTNQWETVVSKACKYDEKGNLIKELDSLGYEAGSGSTPAAKINSGYGKEYQYNNAGKLISVLDPASKDKGLSYSIKYEYDALGRKTKEIDAKGTVNKFYLDNAGNITKVTTTEASGEEKILEENTYDLIGNILTHTDGNGNVTEYWYNNINKVRKVKHPGDETIPEKTVQYQYDELGNLKYQQDSMGIEELYSYDTIGNVLSTTVQSLDESESITVKAAYDKNGNNRFQTDGNGNVTENIYDELNRLVAKKTTVTNTEGEKTEHIIKYAYDLNGNLTEETDWRGNTYSNVYDPLNRLIEKKDSDGKTIEKLEYNHNNAQIKSYDALGNETKFTYDKSNRLLSTTDPEGNVTTQTYDEVGNIETKTDGEGNKTTFKYDELNRLKTVTNALDETTSYTYDLNGNLLAQTDGEGNITSYKYNAANKAKEKTDQEGLSEQYTYYADGNIKTKRDRNGKLTTYTYDAYGNLKATAIEDKIISYTYDNNGNQLTITDETGTTTRVYDELNRVTSKTVPDIGTTTFQYDIIKGVDKGYWAEESTDPKGNKTLKVYDKSGRLAKVTAENKTTEYTYYDNGARKTIEYPDGSKEEYTYYKNNLLKTLINKKADGSIIDSYSYEYDKTNNRIKKTDSKGTTKYAYDKLGRLKTVKENTSLAENRITEYTYDKAGNRKTESITFIDEITQTIYNYNKQNRLLNTIKTVTGKKVEERTYTFDKNGNQLKETIKLFENGIEKETKENKNTFDVLNRLIKTQTSEGITVKNTYNGEGIRVSKEVDGKLRRYLYEYDKVVLELDEQGNTLGRNVYGLNLISRETEGQTAYYMYNGHADVTALIDAEGEILSSYYYDAFGNILESTGNMDNPYRYAGYQYDEETDTYYCMARMYDPYIARFLSEDTYTGDINDPLSLNLYTYCANNPLVYYDPTGHFWEEIKSIGTGAGKGLWDAGKGAVTGVVDILKDTADFYTNDPIGQFKQAGEDVKWLFENSGIAWQTAKEEAVTLGKGIGSAVVKGYNDFKNADLENKSRTITKIVGDVALSILGDKGLSKVKALSKLDNLMDAKKLFNSKANKIVDKINELDIPKYPNKIKSNIVPDVNLLKQAWKDSGSSSVYLGSGFGATQKSLDRIADTVNNYRDLKKVAKETGEAKIFFGQKGVSSNFSKGGKFKGASIESVAEKLKMGTLSPDDLPIEYVVHNGKMITLNNRSLTALSKAGLKPTKLINKTGNTFFEKQITERLAEMGGQPSTSMFIRKIKETIQLP